ncbi:DUF1549 domain-containing protein [Calycomorphotria hydatis]|uniref:Planctomycete cytochrome C n=1 Tax=Calycomorphotria hydatis TaxID=2528027 RepID=A0A517TEL5_9PLAN|nr:DUF1549 domain-containing protein [Calycomorphotria hydatis]QDT66805.1 Planctomycete cytochrome C [Calycomorphotria hydatis]
MLSVYRHIVIVALTAIPLASFAHANELSPEVLRFFENDVRPLLSEHCWTCHSEKEQKGGLRLDTRGHMLLGGESGESIVPGKADESLLIESVRYESYEMPPSGKLKDEQIQILEKWISLGAPWPGADDTVPLREKHGPSFTDEDRAWWAIQPLSEQQIPSNTQAGWGNNEIDFFIANDLEQRGLTPAPPATHEALIRRLYFDLHGLPPTADEVREFVEDDSPDAYERLVDRLLDSPRYGERWARHWLDLVRYADSDGFRADDYRPNAWRYRDYVIRSLNEDKPYDRFVQEQIAGDELFPDDLDAIIATGFYTNGIYEWNARDFVKHWDRMLDEVTDTVGDVFLGVGMQCARCHDHKFDPILQKDYYQLRAFFESIIITTDRVAATTQQKEKHQQELAAWEDATKEIRDEIFKIEEPQRKAIARVMKQFPKNIQEMMLKSEEELSPREKQLALLGWRQVKHDYGQVDRRLKPEQKERVLELRRKLAKFDHLKPSPLPLSRLVTDVGPVAPDTVIPKKKTVCDPGFPALLDVSVDNYLAPATAESTGRRSTLARWLTNEQNPLSTRVIVNRIWQHHFGKGLAPHGSDFGRLGGPPTHPELLDWLTRQFLDGGWRLKHLHRLIVTSATYRQSAQHPDSDEMAAIDPQNEYYWRADARRLDAEQIRDSILAVTGQINDRMGGPGVTADQPRRSIYLRTMRNVRDPLLKVFDQPQFFSSTAARDTTTSPIQSLQLFNSQQMLRYAGQLASIAYRDLEDVEKTDKEEAALRQVWEIVFGRSITEVEQSYFKDFLKQQTELLSEQKSTVDLQRLETGQMPYRNGQSVVFRAEDASSFYVQDNDRLNLADCTIEVYFQIRSIYSSGSPRVLASKWSGAVSEPGWLLGVTGRGSRRKPQTLVFRSFGQKKSNGSISDEIIFSDQHIEFDTPYYAAISFHVSGEHAGKIDFFLKDLSDEEEPMNRVTLEHNVVKVLPNNLPIAFGRMARNREGYFDGLIDDIRISSVALGADDLLFSQEIVTENTLGYWQFDPVPGIYRDSSPNGLDITNVGHVNSAGDARRKAFVDLCHILLNSNEFLYVR